MACNVEHPFGAVQQAWVYFGIEKLFSPADGSGDELSVGVYDCTVTTIDPFFGFGIKFVFEGVRVGDIVFAHGDAAAEHIDASLGGNMLECGMPGWAAIPGG